MPLEIRDLRAESFDMGRPSSAPREAIDSLLSARHSIAFRVDELRAQLEDPGRCQSGEADRRE